MTVSGVWRWRPGGEAEKRRSGEAEKQIPHPSARDADGIRDDSEREALRRPHFG